MKENETAMKPIDVNETIAMVKQYMPDTYQSIKDKAAQIGTEAYALVRRALRGEANCFYAFEAGRVVGTPFNRSDIMAETARYMVQFGCAHTVIWASECCTDAAPPAKA